MDGMDVKVKVGSFESMREYLLRRGFFFLDRTTKVRIISFASVRSFQKHRCHNLLIVRGAGGGFFGGFGGDVRIVPRAVVVCRPSLGCGRSTHSGGWTRNGWVPTPR